uniref:Uncharacterized protein n=1 Tax=Haptolina brevifila TaxID=156173 RepID=A0A7S2N665_9EUKA|mmetsp:Transcript_67414/g.133612  ORF Transcript_67414/g.133612 Transcript_67414/m.133612 type:complete len:126 (+) Transcript_67414:71-448(+)|eukprot:CAMPEP_0174716660 /NCGR_PEP_ID=MMETSP1094-20130205/24380_1 /TAXON_ID=156173 /ORGANISM="Chrysochromulina brevifilum, Strain UTEX LB 985" /LENGTH=125 /DNA_ID=CAMNT_0015916447 /DNA_START=70 /DNA_END=447 /DNA_ORIENTATION=+
MMNVHIYVVRHTADDSTAHGRRPLARVVEVALYFFGGADDEDLEGLLDNAAQHALLRDWLRSSYCPSDAAAAVADHDTQTTAVSMVNVSTAAAPTTRKVSSMAICSPSGARIVISVELQAVVRVL